MFYSVKYKFRTMKNKLFRQILLDNQAFHKSLNILGRGKKILNTGGKPIAFIGPRRAGKTYLSYNQIQHNSKAGFISFEDERLTLLTVNDLDILFQECLSLGFTTLVLDEVQHAPHWEKFITRISQYIHIIFTGSSAKMLSNEIATEMRGRAISYEIFPLSWIEYCLWKNITLKEDISTQQQNSILTHFDQFLKWGGFPEMVKHPHIEILREYTQVMLLRDVVERYKIKNVSVLRTFFLLLIQNWSKECSISKLYKTLKQKHHKVDKEMLYASLAHFQDAYFIFPVKRFDSSRRIVETSLPKIYLIDGISALVHRHSPDHRKHLENYVFLELRKAGFKENTDIFYFKQTYECDFIVKLTPYTEKFLPIQVCYELNEENKKRKIRGLQAGMKATRSNTGIIITYNQEEIREIDGDFIHIIPAWKFCFHPLFQA